MYVLVMRDEEINLDILSKSFVALQISPDKKTYRHIKNRFVEGVEDQVNHISTLKHSILSGWSENNEETT